MTAPTVSFVCVSKTSMDDVPPPCDDGSESDAIEEEEFYAWNHMLELFTLQGSSPTIQQC